MEGKRNNEVGQCHIAPTTTTLLRSALVSSAYYELCSKTHRCRYSCSCCRKLEVESAQNLTHATMFLQDKLCYPRVPLFSPKLLSVPGYNLLSHDYPSKSAAAWSSRVIIIRPFGRWPLLRENHRQNRLWVALADCGTKAWLRQDMAQRKI